ncbi:MAG: Fe-S cluster assembly protein SufB [Puniceicoccales bacterium]|jgi:Fe-S cluster assembly protein SufB|nr:Fe-S cluster assembly protein SufB [Puniceicoccales bacterium]
MGADGGSCDSGDGTGAEWDFSCETDYAYDAGYGLSEETVRYISSIKDEPEWLLQFRLNSLKQFEKIDMPHWAPLKKSDINYGEIRYYLAREQLPRKNWDDVPAAVRETFDRLGVPENERKFLAGVEAQFDSEMAYANLREELTSQGVLFVSSSDGLRDHGEIFRQYFATLVPPGDNTFAALNGAAFSGGSFIYVPPGVHVAQPLQAYFRINAEQFGQFERTLIVVGENAELTYLEGCTAPRFESTTLHAAVVEVIALQGAKVQYITVQNWSDNVYNLVTKRAKAMAGAEIRWIDCNIGSALTMKYPALILAGERARGEVLSISVAKGKQRQDTGARAIHICPNSSSQLISKSLSIDGGSTTFRGQILTAANAHECRCHSRCDAMLIGENAQSQTLPKIDCRGRNCTIEHEASLSKISDEQLFYLRSRGMGESQALSLMVNGFFNDLIREFPMEYGVELKRLIEMEMDDAKGHGQWM